MEVQAPPFTRPGRAIQTFMTLMHFSTDMLCTKSMGSPLFTTFNAQLHCTVSEKLERNQEEEHKLFFSMRTTRR